LVEGIRNRKKTEFDICLVALIAKTQEIYEIVLANRGRFDQGLVLLHTLQKGKKWRVAILLLNGILNAFVHTLKNPWKKRDIICCFQG